MTISCNFMFVKIKFLAAIATNYSSIRILTMMFAKKFFHFSVAPHVWPRGCVLKTGRRDLPGSILDRACRLSHLELSMVFSVIRKYTGYDPLERPPWRAFLYNARSLVLRIGLTHEHQISINCKII